MGLAITFFLIFAYLKMRPSYYRVRLQWYILFRYTALSWRVLLAQNWRHILEQAKVAAFYRASSSLLFYRAFYRTSFNLWTSPAAAHLTSSSIYLINFWMWYLDIPRSLLISAMVKYRSSESGSISYLPKRRRVIVSMSSLLTAGFEFFGIKSQSAVKRRK